MCKFARFCVTVDLTRPLTGHIKIGEIWQRVLYEGLDMVFSRCRRYGHLQQNCLDQQLTSATINASRGQASTSNELVNSAGHRKLADASKIVMSKSADSSSSDDNNPWPKARPCKQHQRRSSGPQPPFVQNHSKGATGTESDFELVDQPKPKSSVSLSFWNMLVIQISSNDIWRLLILSLGTTYFKIVNKSWGTTFCGLYMIKLLLVVHLGNSDMLL